MIAKRSLRTGASVTGPVAAATGKLTNRSSVAQSFRLLRTGMSAPTLHRGVCFVGCGQKHETLGIEGRAEVRTLRFLAAMVFEKLELLARVDAVRGDANAEPAAHADDGGDDRRIGFDGCDVRQKTTIHFD